MCPLLTVLDDGSVLASGDQTKSDTYRISLATAMPKGHGAARGGIARRPATAARPRPHCLRRAVWRFLSQRGRGSRGPTETGPQRGNHSFAMAAIPRRRRSTATRRLAGRSTAAKAGHTPRFSTRAAAGRRQTIDLDLLFECYFSAGLGRFRVWATDDPRPPIAKLPSDVEALLLVSEADRTPAERARLMAHFLSVAPELASERAAVAKLREQLPAFPTTLVMTERPPENPCVMHIHKRGEFLQTD